VITPSLSAGRRGGAAGNNRHLARTAHDHVLDDKGDIRATSIHEPPGALPRLAAALALLLRYCRAEKHQPPSRDHLGDKGAAGVWLRADKRSSAPAAWIGHQLWLLLEAFM